MKICNVCLRKKRWIDFFYFTSHSEILENKPICKDCYTKYLIIDKKITDMTENKVNDEFLKSLRTGIKNMDLILER